MYQGVPGIRLLILISRLWKSGLKNIREIMATALTDTLGTDLLEEDFNKLQAMLILERHDSGDPFKWGDAIIRAL